MKLTSKRVKSAAKSTRIGKSSWHIIECTLELTQTEQNLSGHVTSVISSFDERPKKALDAAWPPTSWYTVPKAVPSRFFASFVANLLPRRKNWRAIWTRTWVFYRIHAPNATCATRDATLWINIFAARQSTRANLPANCGLRAQVCQNKLFLIPHCMYALNQISNLWFSCLIIFKIHERSWLDQCTSKFTQHILSIYWTDTQVCQSSVI